jgi:hypothetical protein
VELQKNNNIMWVAVVGRLASIYRWTVINENQTDMIMCMHVFHNSNDKSQISFFSSGISHAG